MVCTIPQKGETMTELFAKEREILDRAAERLRAGASCDAGDYAALARDYEALLAKLETTVAAADHRVADLNRQRLALREMVRRDTLTGTFSRQYLEEKLAQIIRLLSRSGGGVLSVLIVDVDYFKKYNDTYGHYRGDCCLKAVADAIVRSVDRSCDFVARYGGEEFVVVLPGTDEWGAEIVGNRILDNVRRCAVPHSSSKAAGCVTVSVGATTADVRVARTGGDYIRRADMGLYASKRNGRDRYTFTSFAEPPATAELDKAANGG